MSTETLFQDTAYLFRNSPIPQLQKDQEHRNGPKTSKVSFGTRQQFGKKDPKSDSESFGIGFVFNALQKQNWLVIIME